MDYFETLVEAMDTLSKDDRTIFIGQSVQWDGHALFKTMKNVPMEKRLELPVFEDFQAGMATGLALEGYIPISIYPRFDFLLLATNQLFNHLDNIEYFSHGTLKPKVIIRVCVGTIDPLDPGIQHRQDYTEAFKLMAKTIEVISLDKKELILQAYDKALNREDGRSTILVEYADYYHKL